MLPQLKSKFGKVSRYKKLIHTKKSLAFLYNNNERIFKREFKETIPFAIASKRIKYQTRNLPKEVKKTCIQKL